MSTIFDDAVNIAVAEIQTCGSLSTCCELTAAATRSEVLPNVAVAVWGTARSPSHCLQLLCLPWSEHVCQSGLRSNWTLRIQDARA